MTENNSARPVVVTYEPRILRSMAEICKVFGVAKETVREWKNMGAPISVENGGKCAIARRLCVFSYGAKSCQVQITGLDGSLRVSTGF